MKTCPLGHTCPECHWNVRLRGVNPNTGQDVDEDGCAIAWLPVLLIENTREQIKGTNTVGDFRDRMVKGNQQIAQALVASSKEQHELLDWDPREILP